MLIVVATHKEKSIVHNNIIKGIHVGVDIGGIEIDSSYLKDNTGDNISLKNENYSELTALYWLWKNCSNQDVVGLMHYRRYLFPFSGSYINFRKKRIIHVNSTNDKIKKINNVKRVEKQVNSLLRKYDVILPVLADYSHKGRYPSLFSDYREHHVEEHWLIMEKVLIEKYPEYKESIARFFYGKCLIYGTNMFIAKYEWCSTYCAWLFDILFEVEKRIKIPEDIYQKRVFGFLSERLFTLFVLNNKFKIKEVSTLFVDDIIKVNEKK